MLRHMNLVIHWIAWIAALTAVGALRITAAGAVEEGHRPSCLAPEISRQELIHHLAEEVPDTADLGKSGVHPATEDEFALKMDALLADPPVTGSPPANAPKQVNILPFIQPPKDALVTNVPLVENKFLTSKEPLPAGTIDVSSRRIDGYVIGPSTKYTPELIEIFRTKIKPYLTYHQGLADLTGFFITKYKALSHLSFDPHESSESRLLAYYGDRLSSYKLLGKGGFSDAYQVCDTAHNCWLAKVRMIRNIHELKSEKEIESALEHAHAVLLRDVAAGEIAEDLFKNNFKFHGKPLPVQVLKAHDTASLAYGIIESNLIPKLQSPLFPTPGAWRSELDNVIQSLRKANTKKTLLLAKQLESIKESVKDVHQLRTNLLVIENIRRIAMNARRFQSRAAMKFCNKALAAIALPKNHDEIVMAIEQVHRVSSDWVTAYFASQRNLTQGVPLFNKVRIKNPQGVEELHLAAIGLDLNHGTNFGFANDTYYDFDQ